MWILRDKKTPGLYEMKRGYDTVLVAHYKPFLNPVNTTCETRLLAATGYENFTGLLLQHWTLK